METNNPLTKILMNIAKNTNQLDKAIKSGEGMNLTDEQKKEYYEQLEKQGVNEKLSEVKSQLDQLFKRK